MVEHIIETFTNSDTKTKEDRFSVDVECILTEIFKKQDAFQVTNGLDVPICDLASAIMCEGGELWDISGGKWWKKYLEGKDVRGRLHYDEPQDYLWEVEKRNKPKILDESIDLLHFLVATWLKLKVNPKDVFIAYSRKMDVNIKRQNDGY